MKTVRTAKRHIPLIIGNWKMNPQTRAQASELAVSLKKVIPKKGESHIYVAPPAPFLSDVAQKLGKSRTQLGVQDVSSQEGGAHTGESGVSMFQSFGVSLYILGHSERRAGGETNEAVAQKLARVLKAKATAVVCVGETKRDQNGEYFSVVESQLRAVLNGLTPASVSRLVIAYEPVWAIGTGKHATAEDVQEMKLFIQKVISDTLSRSAVAKVRILYGGSVTKDNAQELLEVGKADGFLIGGSSLKPSEFSAIISTADSYAQS